MEATTFFAPETDCFRYYLNHVHERSEAGRGGIPLRKIEVLCSDDAADRCLRIVGLTVRLPQTPVAA